MVLLWSLTIVAKSLSCKFMFISVFLMNSERLTHDERKNYRERGFFLKEEWFFRSILSIRNNRRIRKTRKTRNIRNTQNQGPLSSSLRINLQLPAGSWRGDLPNMCSLFLGDEELVALLHLEGVVPGVYMRQGGVHTSLVGRVGVDGDEVFHILGAHVAGPYACPAEEEALLGGESVDDAQRLLFHAVLQGAEGNVDTTIVADVLAEGLLAVDFLAGNSLNSAEIVLKHLRALIVVFLVEVGPPVVLVAGLVKLRSLVI